MLKSLPDSAPYAFAIFIALDDNGIDGLDGGYEDNMEGATRYRILVKIAAWRCISFNESAESTLF